MASLPQLAATGDVPAGQKESLAAFFMVSMLHEAAHLHMRGLAACLNNRYPTRTTPIGM